MIYGPVPSPFGAAAVGRHGDAAAGKAAAPPPEIAVTVGSRPRANAPDPGRPSRPVGQQDHPELDVNVRIEDEASWASPARERLLAAARNVSSLYFGTVYMRSLPPAIVHRPSDRARLGRRRHNNRGPGPPVQSAFLPALPAAAADFGSRRPWAAESGSAGSTTARAARPLGSVCGADVLVVHYARSTSDPCFVRPAPPSDDFRIAAPSARAGRVARAGSPTGPPRSRLCVREPPPSPKWRTGVTPPRAGLPRPA